MNITYLIGNGFDIACGLKTRYTDFIKTYVESPSENTNLAEFKKIIEQDLCTWADAELAFGAYTQTVADPGKFIVGFNDFLDKMALYFSQEQSKFDFNTINDEQKAHFLKGIIEYDRFLCLKSKMTLSSCVSGKDCDKISTNFLVFNYTMLFKKLLETCLPINCCDIDYYRSDNVNCHCTFKPVQYVHGCLDEPPLIFGVNDTNQISYMPFRTRKVVIDTLVKPNENQESRPVEVNLCEQTLYKSDIICLYGMSLGATDSLWWNMIVKWLSENNNANLIIHYWNERCHGYGSGIISLGKEECINRFFNNAQTRIHSLTSLKERIHVVLNQNPFHIVMHAQ